MIYKTGTLLVWMLSSICIVLVINKNGVLSDAEISNGFRFQVADVVPGKLIYFDEHTVQDKPPFRFSDIIRETRRPPLSSLHQNNLPRGQQQITRVPRPPKRLPNGQNTLWSNSNSVSANNRNLNSSSLEQKRSRYRKGKVQLATGDFDSEKTGERQGLNCRGICRYIPDVDFCPTNTRQTEINNEAADDTDNYDEDDYDGTDEGNNSESQRSRLPVTIRPGILMAIPIPFFTLSKASSELLAQGLQQQRRQAERERANASRQRQPLTARENRRNRRPQLSPGQSETSPGSALEQELVLKRWDRVAERGPYLGGDIVEPAVPPGILLRPGNFRGRRQWPNGVIPFVMDSSLNTCRQDAIFDAMDEIESKTCVQFVERENERNYLNIQKSVVGCSSYVGMIGGGQNLNLSTGCFSKFTVVHELLHAVGFEHEQAREDRDNFIQVDFENVIRGKERQFEKDPGFTGSGLPYDLRSIMHYSAFLFARDRCEPTIFPVNDSFDICDLGAGDGRGGMTKCDAAKINKLYKCGRNYTVTCSV